MGFLDRDNSWIQYGPTSILLKLCDNELGLPIHLKLPHVYTYWSLQQLSPEFANIRNS